MAITLKAQTLPDKAVAEATVTGAQTSSFQLTWGDDAHPETITFTSPSVTLTRRYTVPTGPHQYTITVAETLPAWASDLTELAAKAATLRGLDQAVPAPGTLERIGAQLTSRDSAQVDVLATDIPTTDLKVTGVRQPDPAVWHFQVAGVSKPPADRLSVDWGDRSAVEHYQWPLVDPPLRHRYVRPGYRIHTSTFSAPVHPYASTYQQLSTYGATYREVAYGSPKLTTLADVLRKVDVVKLAVEVIVGDAAIRARVTDDPSGVVQIDTRIAERTTDAGDPIPVKGWRIFRMTPDPEHEVRYGTSSSGAASFEDRLPPYGVPIQYRLEVEWGDGHTFEALSNVVVISHVRGCWLSDPYRVETISVTLQAWPERLREARRSVMAVLGRADPVTISDVHLSPRGSWTFYTSTEQQLAALLNILGGAQVVYLRTQLGASIATVFASVGDIAERRWSGRGGDQRRLTEVAVQEVRHIPAQAADLQASLEKLAELAGTLRGLHRLRLTLMQLSRIRFSTSYLPGEPDA